MTGPATDELNLDFVRDTSSDPWVSVLLPSLRGAPDSRAGSTQLANLLREASAQLKARELSDDLLAPAAELVGDTALWQQQFAGLALYLTPNGMHRFRVPMEFAPTVVVGDVPHLRPLVPAMAPGQTYYLLQLSQKHVRLFEVAGGSIHELDRGAIPGSLDEVEGDREHQERVQFSTPGGGGTMRGHGADSGVLEAQRERFLRQVAHGVEERLGRREPAVPLVLAGVDDLVGAFRPLCSYPGLTDLTVHGSADGLSPTEVLDRARPVLDAHREQVAQRRADRLKELRAGNRLVEAPADILVAAQEGRVEALLVGADPERVDGGPSDDVVDRLIVATVGQGGKVLPMPSATADTLIAVLRF